MRLSSSHVQASVIACVCVNPGENPFKHIPIMCIGTLANL